MESVFALISIVVGVWILGTPILALIAFNRASRLQKELPELKESHKLLSEQVSRLQARVQRVLNELEGIKPTEGAEETEAEADTFSSLPQSVITYDVFPGRLNIVVSWAEEGGSFAS